MAADTLPTPNVTEPNLELLAAAGAAKIDAPFCADAGAAPWYAGFSRLSPDEGSTPASGHQRPQMKGADIKQGTALIHGSQGRSRPRRRRRRGIEPRQRRTG